MAVAPKRQARFLRRFPTVVGAERVLRLHGLQLLVTGFMTLALFAGCVSRQTWDAVALQVVYQPDGCELLKTVTETRSYVWTAESLLRVPFVHFMSVSSEKEMREIRRRVDADIQAEIMNEAAEVEGANAVLLRTTKRSDTSITMAADVLFCERFSGQEAR